MRKFLIFFTLFALMSSANAGSYKTHRMSDGSVLTFKRHEGIMPLGTSPTEPWDAQKVYRVPVILFSFEDCDFSCDDPQQFYNRLFNEHGYNLGKGPGCVADYFHDQSNSLFNIQFDIIGPVKLSLKQKSSDGQGNSQMVEAVRLVDPQVNFADYDWNNNGRVPAVIFLYAGYGSNEIAEVADGCIYPNTGPFNMEADGVMLMYYSISNEIWSNKASCGIGTICHEYCHTIGIPDLYPTYDDGPEFSVLDDWDLMDGGCYANDGWCPPNLSIHERELLNWSTPVDITVPTHVSDMPSYDNSGIAYRIVNEAYPSEFYLLENRQQIGWDLMLPGHGLLISHVDYNEYIWQSNTINNNPSHHRFDYFHADGLDVNYYIDLYGLKSIYNNDGRSIRLQYTAYPYTDAEGIVYDALTDTSKPAATLYHAQTSGSLLMGKSITQIQENDGLISFHFSNTPDAIVPLSADNYPVAIYDLHGHILPRDSHSLSPGIYLYKFADGTIKKVFR